MERLKMMLRVAVLAVCAAGCATQETHHLDSKAYDDLIQLMGDQSIPEDRRKSLSRFLMESVERDPCPAAIEALVRATSDNRRHCSARLLEQGNGMGDFADYSDMSGEIVDPKKVGDGEAKTPVPSPDDPSLSVGYVCGGILADLLEIYPYPYAFLWKYDHSWQAWWAKNKGRTLQEWRDEVQSVEREERERRR